MAACAAYCPNSHGFQTKLVCQGDGAAVELGVLCRAACAVCRVPCRASWSVPSEAHELCLMRVVRSASEVEIRFGGAAPTSERFDVVKL